MLNMSSSVTRQPVTRARKADAPSVVFALGRLGYDFGSEARRDYFLQRLGGTKAQPFAALALAEYLREHPEDAHGLTWTLTLDGTPIYALEPLEQFAATTAQQLIRLLAEQEKEGVEHISLAGCLVGSTCLLNGSSVPKVIPVMRGMACWNVARFTTRCLGELPAGEDSDERERYEERQAYLQRFLTQLSQKAWNLGASVKDRALNFAITHAFRVGEVFEDAFKAQLVLDSVRVEGSTQSSPGSECWDVKLRFRDPAGRHENARKVYRYTVDVSDSIPCIVGGLHTRFEF
jgi:cyanobactin maturation PatA/PatG family protease